MEAASPPPLPGPISSGEGFWIRAGARVIDTLYGLILGFFAGILAGIALIVLERGGLIAPGWQSRAHGLNPIGLVLGLLGNLCYHSFTEGLFGASFGKLLCGLRVVTVDGQPIGFGQALKRSLLYFWDALFFGVVAYVSMRESDLNQRYGDRWAKTVVVKSADVPASSKKTGLLFVLGLLIGSAIWAACNALGLILHAR